MSEPTCAKCASENIIVSKKKQLWACEDCVHECVFESDRSHRLLAKQVSHNNAASSFLTSLTASSAWIASCSSRWTCEG